jgi:hypothetical protein
VKKKLKQKQQPSISNSMPSGWNADAHKNKKHSYRSEDALAQKRCEIQAELKVEVIIIIVIIITLSD